MSHARVTWASENKGQDIQNDMPRPKNPPGLKPKDLVGVPWRVAFALQADGWYLRSDIIWHKPNPMPESVTDRPTKSHEYLFLLSKSQRYFYDAEAVKEATSEPDDGRVRFYGGANKGPVLRESGIRVAGNQVVGNPPTRNRRSVWTMPSEPYSQAHFATYPTALVKPCILAGTSAKGCCPKCGTPWERVTEPFGEYAEALKKKTWSSGGLERGNAKPAGYDRLSSQTQTLGWRPGCECDGIDWRIVASPTGERAGDDPSIMTGRAGMNRPRGDNEGQRPITRYEQAEYAKQLKVSPYRSEMESEVGEEAFAHYLRTDDSGARPPRPDCLETWISRGWIHRVTIPETSPLSPIPCTVLDPFAGSGTTGAVALELGRHAVLVELNPAYVAMIRQRCAITPGLQLA